MAHGERKKVVTVFLALFLPPSFFHPSLCLHLWLISSNLYAISVSEICLLTDISEFFLFSVKKLPTKAIKTYKLPKICLLMTVLTYFIFFSDKNPSKHLKISSFGAFCMLLQVFFGLKYIKQQIFSKNVHQIATTEMALA